MVVEITNVCNFNCPQCAYTPPADKRFIRVDTFALMARQAAEAGAELIRFLGLGEPTLHPRIGTLISTVRRAGLASHLISNGSFTLRPAVREEIARHLPDVLEISLDAATPASFRLTRGRTEAYYTQLIDAVGEFMSRARPDGRQMVVSFVAHPETLQEIPLFRQRWSGLADAVRIRVPHTFSGQAAGLPSQRGASAQSTPSMPSCSFLTDRIAVAADGTVSSCNLDFDQRHVLGQLGNGFHLADLWRSPRRLALRARVEKGNSDAQCSTCSKCAGLVFR
ncbi:MAG TPA: radical SAM protein [Streptosporangiaceae bacterium]